MPFLQFLTGSRDQQFEELNPQASLVIGSGADAHIQVSDPGVEAKHCQVYPAQNAFWLQDLGTGQTIFNFKRIASATEGLKSNDVFIIGRTFVKFWEQKPPATAGDAAPAAAAGADPAALEAAQQAAAEAKQALQTLQASSGELEQAKQAAEQRAEQAEQSLADAEQRAEALQGDLDAATQRAAEAEAKASELEGQLSDAQRAGEEAAEAARAEAEAARSELEQSLEAARAALDGLRAEAETRGRDRLAAAFGDPSDLTAAIAALELSDAIRHRLEAAVDAHVDREVIRRSAGPVVPLRDLTVPGLDRDLAAEVAAIRRRGEQVDAARDLDLHALDEAELARLLEMARG